MQRGDLFAQRLTRATVVDHVVGRRDTLSARRLGAHDGAHYVFGKPGARAHACDLRFLGAVDHQHPVNALAVVGRLDEQRHDMHDVRPGGGRDAPGGFLADHRVQQRLELSLRGLVREHALAHLLAVHRALAAHRLRAEELLYASHGGAALRRELMCNDVRIDNRGAERGKVGRGGGFSAADAAGKSHHEGHSRCRYQRRMGSPQNMATMPAMARYGPKWKRKLASQRPRAANICSAPKARPTSEENKITNGNSCNPRNATTAAFILKSP